jgi:hypothetical protein
MTAIPNEQHEIGEGNIVGQTTDILCIYMLKNTNMAIMRNFHTSQI